MQLDDEPARQHSSSFFDSSPPSPVEAAVRQYAEAVSAFEAAFEGFIDQEMQDAEIERAFRYALAEWRRTAPGRVEAEREQQRRDREAQAELRRYWQEHPTEAPPPMIDPAWVFERRQAADAGTSGPIHHVDGSSAAVPRESAQADAIASSPPEVEAVHPQDARQIRQDDSGEAPSLKERPD